MVLSDAEALQLLTNPTNRQAISEAQRWQHRTRFHGLTVRDKIASVYWPVFRNWVYGFLLVDDKRQLFNQIFPFPVPTTRLLAEVQDYWQKIHDSVNPQFDISADDGVESDFLKYLADSGENKFWASEAISTIIESHNDVLIIDIRPGVRPEPYITRCAVDSLLSVEFNADGEALHIAYKAVGGKKIIIDDVCYRVYSNTADKETNKYADLLEETFVHNLGRCPARLLWDERVPNQHVATQSPVDEVLSELDSYCFWYVAYEMFKLYGSFPIYYGMQTNDQNPLVPVAPPRNPDGTIDAGFRDSPLPNRPAGSSFIAPGDFLEMPPGSDMSVAPVGIVEPSTDTLNFHVEDIDRLYNRLVGYLTGGAGESAMMDKAVNEKQVTGNFASKENTLRYISRHLSAARQWTLLTIGQLRYGTALRSVSFSFGTEFYLQNESDLWAGLTLARTAGSPQSVLAEKIAGIQSFRLRSGGNPSRSRILLDLEPLPEQPLSAVGSLVISGVVSPEKYAVKANFTDLIADYERMFGADIVDIGSALPYNQKLALIKTYLYANVKYSPIIPEASPGENSPGSDRKPVPKPKDNERNPVG